LGCLIFFGNSFEFTEPSALYTFHSKIRHFSIFRSSGLGPVLIYWPRYLDQ